jgi:hypothetical protein
MAFDSTGVTALRSHAAMAMFALSLLLGGPLRPAIAQQAGAQQAGDQQAGDQQAGDQQADDQETEIERVRSIMYFDPPFEYPKSVYRVPPAPIPLWQRALERDDAELRRMTIDTIAMAKRRGMPEIEQFTPQLVRIATAGDSASEVRRAAVNALIAFEAKDHAKTLAEVSQRYGRSIAMLVEPALIKWKSDVLADSWRQRLSDPGLDSRRLRYAIEGIGAIRDLASSDELKSIVLDRFRSSQLRMAAARSLGLIHSQGLDELAQTLAQRDSNRSLNALLGIALLAQHDAAASIDLLKELASRPTTAVQSEALARLMEIDHALVLPFAESHASSPDVNVRRTIAGALQTSRDSRWIPLLSRFLDDVHPQFRRQTATELVALAEQDSLRQAVISATTKVLNENAWRGCEQATIVLVNLDHQAASDRFVELLHHPRGEVMKTAAWGLRRFALEKHLPDMLSRANEIYSGFVDGSFTGDEQGAEEMVAQLFMAFGQMRYQPADELMRKYIPKNFALGYEARPAACWALGYLHENEADAALTKALLERIADVNSLPPEAPEVRRMSAVSVGRIKTESAVPELETHTEGFRNTVARACNWSIVRITGQPRPFELRRSVLEFNEWFLKPREAQ